MYNYLYIHVAGQYQIYVHADRPMFTAAHTHRIMQSHSTGSSVRECGLNVTNHSLYYL